MSLIGVAFLAFIAVPPGNDSIPTSSVPTAARKRAEEIIQVEAARRRGASYPEGREWTTGDLDGDGMPDFAVLYSIEVGNNYTEYLLVTLGKGDAFQAVGPVRVGGRGRRFVWFDHMTRNRIQLRTKTFGPNDAMCCPGVEGRTTFMLQDKTIREERRGEVSGPRD